jgi:hypothetical protein
VSLALTPRERISAAWTIGQKAVSVVTVTATIAAVTAVCAYAGSTAISTVASGVDIAGIPTAESNVLGIANAITVGAASIVSGVAIGDHRNWPLVAFLIAGSDFVGATLAGGNVATARGGGAAGAAIASATLGIIHDVLNGAGTDLVDAAGRASAIAGSAVAEAAALSTTVGVAAGTVMTTGIIAGTAVAVTGALATRAIAVVAYPCAIWSAAAAMIISESRPVQVLSGVIGGCAGVVGEVALACFQRAYRR